MSEIKHIFWDDEFKKQVVGKKPNAKAVLDASTSAKLKQSQRFLVPDCSHWRQRFELDDGLHVFASAWFDKPQTLKSSNAASAAQIDIGFYLDSRWASESLLVSPGLNPPFGKRTSSPRIVLFPWEDWGVPANHQLFRRALRWLLKEASRGKKIEIGCMGGHGRTGTALACLLMVQGLGHSRAVSKVWSRYCEEAIESRNQLDFIRSFGR